MAREVSIICTGSDSGSDYYNRSSTTGGAGTTVPVSLSGEFEADSGESDSNCHPAALPVTPVAAVKFTGTSESESGCCRDCRPGPGLASAQCRTGGGPTRSPGPTQCFCAPRAAFKFAVAPLAVRMPVTPRLLHWQLQVEVPACRQAPPATRSRGSRSRASLSLTRSATTVLP